MRATASHGQGLSITVISQFDFSCFVGCKMVNYMCIHNYIYIYIHIHYTMLYPYDPLCVLAKRTMILPAKSPSFGGASGNKNDPKWLVTAWFMVGQWSVG